MKARLFLRKTDAAALSDFLFSGAGLVVSLTYLLRSFA